MNSDDKDLLKKQTNQVFNMVENPVMEYISKFMEETPNIIFKEDIPSFIEPFILLPWGDYKKDICIKFTLVPINADEATCKEKIDSLIKYENIKEAIGFLFYCVKIVYPSVVASCMINNKPLLNTKLELDEENWVFRPVFLHELNHKRIFLEESLTKLFEMKNNMDQLPPEMVDEVNAETADVIKSLSEVNEQITQDVLDIEKNINISYNDKAVLGIFVEEININDLPKNREMENIVMPSVTNNSYFDPDDMPNLD